MCGVLGIAIKNFNEKDCDLVRNLFRQSMIRGKHATGVSYVKNNTVHTFKEPVPADLFIQNQNITDWVNEDGNLYCIAHIRYSTSDLRYNQPFSTDTLSIVHNGVISQESPESWETTYGYKTKTANDSELILHATLNNEAPLQKFIPSSMAVCTLNSDKTITAYRNQARPLYYSVNERSVVFTSTKNIAKRSGLTSIQKSSMFTVYSVHDFKLEEMYVPSNVKYLQ